MWAPVTLHGTHRSARTKTHDNARNRREQDRLWLEHPVRDRRVCASAEWCALVVLEPHVRSALPSAPLYGGVISTVLPAANPARRRAAGALAALGSGDAPALVSIGAVCVK